MTYCFDYKDNIYTNDAERENDIIKLWRYTPCNALALIGCFFNKKEIPDFIKPIWIEQTAKKMTIKEIEKELGYSIEIISESDSEENK